MKNILKNKLLYILIFFVFILASFFVTNSVFAGEFVFDNVAYETSSEFDEHIGSKNYIVILKSPANNLYLIYGFTDKPVFHYKAHNYYPDYVGSIPANSSYSDYGWCSLDKLFLTSNHINNYCYDVVRDVCTISAYDKNPSNVVVYSNFDIYCDDKLVFQGAPLPVEQVIIPEITQVAEIPQVMTQIMKILIPIGLIIFGIGLLIYLVRLVTSRMI